MSASPPHAGVYPASDARKRKRARDEDDSEGDQATEQNGGNGVVHGGTRSSASPRPSTATSTSALDTRQTSYTSAYGRSQLPEISKAADPDPGATATVPSTVDSHQQQQPIAQTSNPQASGYNGHGSLGNHEQRQTQPHASRAARSGKSQRILTKDTLEPSYFVVEPNDEFTREVGDWLWGWIKNRADVEIEGKIGLLVDARPGLPPKTRVSFPLATETILTDTTFARFQSNMSLRQHHHFNQILNMRATEVSQPGYTGAPIRYLHTKEVDAFYHSPQQISGGGAGKTKVRVTRDQTTGQIKNDPKASVRKSRIADMNIYSPKRGFDFRISVSVEEASPIPTSKPTHERWKDRVSYKHQAFQIDLTQVRSSENKEVLHELEIEFSDMPLLMQEGEKAERGEESLYYDLVQVFLNNAHPERLSALMAACFSFISKCWRNTHPRIRH